MKKTKNNSYLYAFYHSGIFLPFILFFIIVILNNAIFFYKSFLSHDWRYYLAFFGGCNHDLFIFSLIALILAFFCWLLPALKKISLILLHILLFLPILDFLYFRATLERFNWVVLQFINTNSTKGYIGNMGTSLLWLLIFVCILVISFYYSIKRDKYSEPFFFKPLVSICIFTFFASFFTHNLSFTTAKTQYGDKELVFGGEYYKNIGKNTILKNLSKGSLYAFIVNRPIVQNNISFKPYTDKEKTFLEQNGLIPAKSDSDNNVKFNKVIMIVLESFALEYIHAFNPDIPQAASPYFDYLVNNYPYSSNFYTSDFPSLQGFNALLGSKIPFNASNHSRQNYNLASMLEQKESGSTWFLRGSSRAYGNEEIAVRNIFGFSNLIGYEDLAKSYPEPEGYVWGYEDNILYDKAYNILSDEKNRCSLMIIKLLNQHQPVSESIVNAPDQPESVKSHPSKIVKAIYDADKQIKNFINRCESSSLIDDKTLIIITADHYPPLGYEHTELVKSDNHFQLGKLPLIFYSKQKNMFKDLNPQAQSCQLDIAPTLCYLLGLEIPQEQIGQNLLSSNYIPRSIGILNRETLFFQSENFEFTESLSRPATSTIAIKKWINNLLVN